MTVTPPTLLLLVVSWPQSLWTLHECLYFRGPLPNPWGWLTEPLGFGRTPVKNHWARLWSGCRTSERTSLEAEIEKDNVVMIDLERVDPGGWMVSWPNWRM